MRLSGALLRPFKAVAVCIKIRDEPLIAFRIDIQIKILLLQQLLQ